MTEMASGRMLQASAPADAATKAAAATPQTPLKPQSDVCNLSCRNGGVCQHPKEEAGFVEPMCSCPDGYLGVLCEIKVRVCDKGSRGKCMNEQACIPENNGQFYHCECDPDVFEDTVSGENAKYNLQYCQSVTTTWCDGGGAVKSGETNRKDMHYCYNAGKCKSKRRGYTCDCPPGWSGAHCAMPTDMAAAAGQDGDGGGIAGRLVRFLLITTLVFTVLMLCAIGCLIQYGQVKSRRRKRQARRRRKERQNRRNKGGQHRRLRQRRSDDDNNEGIEMSEMGNTRDTDSEDEASESESSEEESGSEASADEESDDDDEFEDERSNRKR